MRKLLKRRSLQQRKSYCNLYGLTLAADNKAKSHSKLLSKSRNFLPTPREQREARKPHSDQSESRMTPHTPHVCGWSIRLKGAIRTLLQQISSGGQKPYDPSYHPTFRIPLTIQRIIDRPGLKKIQGVPSTAHKLLKFPVGEGIVTLRSNTTTPAECKMVAEALNESLPNERTAAEGIKVAIHPKYPEHTVTIGGSLSKKGKMEICDLLRSNLDIFACKTSDMTGVPRSIAERRLNVHEGCSPIRQKRRGQAPDRNKAIQDEVTKLLEAQIMREVHYHNWISNPSHVREAVSAVLLTERDSQQMPVQAPEINYSSMEKLVLALVHASRRLRRYFQAYPIAVITDQPIKQILPRTSISGKVLADFIAERPDEGGPLIEIQDEEAVSNPWTLFMDGSSCREGLGSRLVLTNQEGIEFTYALRFEFEVSNNEAEYEALVAGLHIAEQMGVENLEVKVDSRLVANQINESYVAKEQSMIQNLEKAKTLISGFKKLSIKQVSGSENKKADALSKIASTSFTHLTKQVLVEVLKEKSIEEREILAVVEEEGYCWMTSLLEYLTDSTLPAETKKARTIKIKSRQCALINGVLYHK
ncbi:reverse transcriptase domain-containing protein [Tanacetum coccineum]